MKYLSRREAAQRLGLSKHLISDLIAFGELTECSQGISEASLEVYWLEA